MSGQTYFYVTIRAACHIATYDGRVGSPTRIDRDVTPVCGEIFRVADQMLPVMSLPHSLLAAAAGIETIRE